MTEKEELVALWNTVNVHLAIGDICPQCGKAFLVTGFVCSECRYDDSDTYFGND